MPAFEIPGFTASETIDRNTGEMPAEGGLTLLRKSQQGCQTAGRPMMRARNPLNGTCIFFQVACKTWGCPACAERNAMRTVLHAVHGSNALMKRGEKLEFLTITSHEKLDEKGSFYVLPIAWNKLNRRIKRATSNPNPAYFGVPEQHSDGRWHFHAVVNFALKPRWFKDNARECGLGYEVDVETIEDVGKVSFYISKYMGKQLMAARRYKSLRRVRHSNNWEKLPETPLPMGWEFKIIEQKQTLQQEVSDAQHAGYHVILADEFSSWDIVMAR